MTVKTLTVSNATQLAAAIKLATGGETINLATGNYGGLNFYKFTPTATVTIQSGAGQHAMFSTISGNTVSNLTFNNIEVTMNAGTGAATAPSLITFKTSNNLKFNNIDVHGSIDGNVLNDCNGMRITTSRDVTVTNSHFHDLNAGAGFQHVSALVVAGNTVNYMREGLGFGDVHGTLVDHNLIYDVIPNYVQDKTISVAAGDHPDMIQFWTAADGASSDVTISNNALLLGKGMDTHGIFVTSQDTTYHSNFVIANNLISTNNANGLTVGNMHGAEITNNTVLTSAGSTYLAMVRVMTSDGIKMANNVSTYFSTAGSSVAASGNVQAHSGGAMDVTNVARLFSNAMKAGTTSVDDFAKLMPLSAGFDSAAYKAPVTLAAYDTLAHSLDTGGFLHHIA